MDSLPTELYDYIFSIKYKMEYNEVLRELESHFSYEPFIDFIYPFKNTIILDDDIIYNYESDTDLIEYYNVLDYIILSQDSWIRTVTTARPCILISFKFLSSILNLIFLKFNEFILSISIYVISLGS